MNNMNLKREYRDRLFFARKLAFFFIWLSVISLLLNVALLVYINRKVDENIPPSNQLPPVDVINEPQETLPICSAYTFKSWMPYQAITNRNSQQWELQQVATTGQHGIREVDGYQLVALGNFYADKTIGKKFDITLSTGEKLKVMVGDIKDDNHTDETNCYSIHDRAMMEFIVDKEGIDPAVRYHGDFSFIYPGHIIYIQEVKP